MPTAVRAQKDPYQLVALHDKILRIPNTASVVKSMNLFKKDYTTARSIVFDRQVNTHTLLAATNRNADSPTTRPTSNADRFSMVLGYYHDMDKVSKDDWANKVRVGTDNEQLTKAEVIFEKQMQQRIAVDATHEWMMLQLIKTGICTDTAGNVLSNLFADFNETQIVIDFDLANNTDVAKTVRQLRKSLQENLMTGDQIAPIVPVMVSTEFFDKLVANPSVSAFYKNWSASARYLQAMDSFTQFGTSAVFEYQGILFFTYDYNFPMNDGSVQPAIAADEGHVIPKVNGTNKSILRAVYGDSRNEKQPFQGREMFLYNFMDDKGFGTEIHLETSPLFYCEAPLALHKVVTSS